MIHTPREIQKECNHKYPKRADTLFRWRCMGCGIMKWYWTYKINKH